MNEAKSSIYVASSWRNLQQPEVVRALRAAGHPVYDFRNPEEGDHGFSWRQCDPSWKPGEPVTAAQLRQTLQHPIAQKGFAHDFRGMAFSNACVLVLPCGRSAHIEAGWFTGRGRPLVVLTDTPCEPELMYLLGGGIVVSTVEDVVSELAKVDLRSLEDERYTHAEMSAIALSLGVPGPDVDEHPIDYDGECYCRSCLDYA